MRPSTSRRTTSSPTWAIPRRCTRRHCAVGVRARSTGDPGSSWKACAGGGFRLHRAGCSRDLRGDETMTVDLVDAHTRALASTRRFVAAVRADQWDTQSNCDDWDVRTLVNHIVSGNFWAAELMAGKTIEEVGDRLDGDIIGADALASWDASSAAADGAFRAPGAMERPAAVSYGPVPGSVYLRHRFVDVLVHGWDVAVSTGQPAALDPELVAACWEAVQPDREMMAASGAFGIAKEL